MRSVIYALIIAAAFLVSFLFGLFSVVRLGFIAVFFAVNIFRGIDIIYNDSYSDSIFREILKSFKAPLVAGLILMFALYPFPSV